MSSAFFRGSARPRSRCSAGARAARTDGAKPLALLSAGSRARRRALAWSPSFIGSPTATPTMRARSARWACSPSSASGVSRDSQIRRQSSAARHSRSPRSRYSRRRRERRRSDGDAVRAARRRACAAGRRDGDIAPVAAHRVAAELCARLDVALELRERIAEAALLHAAPAASRTRKIAAADARPRACRRHATVVVVIRKISGERRWRRWAVLIARRTLITILRSRGVRRAPARCRRARPRACSTTVIASRRPTSTTRGSAIAAAARASGEQLPSVYYVGRDLLDLGDAHLSRARVHPTVGDDRPRGRADRRRRRPARPALARALRAERRRRGRDRRVPALHKTARRGDPAPRARVRARARVAAASLEPRRRVPRDSAT